MPRERQMMPNNTLNKGQKMLHQALKKQLDMKDQPCKMPNKTLQKDGKRLNKVHLMHITIQQIN